MRNSLAKGGLARLIQRINQQDAVLAGIILMVLAMFLFSVADVMAKWLVGGYALAQVLLIRSLAALVVAAPLIAKTGLGPILRAPRPALQALRVVLSAVDVAAFYWAVKYLPLADVMTFFLAAPIYATALAVPLLGERVGWRRSLAIAAGFAGVLIALNPAGISAGWPAVAAFLGSVGYAALLVVTRLLRGTSDTSLVVWQLAGISVLAAFFAPFGWINPGWHDLLLMVLTGVLSLLGHMAINRSLKLASINVLAPYQYTPIVWAILFGFIVFNDVPGPHMLAGAAVIIAAGLYIFFRERKLGLVPDAASGDPSRSDGA